MNQLRRNLVSSQCFKWAVCFEFEACDNIEQSIRAIFSNFDMHTISSQAVPDEIVLLKILDKGNDNYVISVNGTHMFYPKNMESLQHWIYEICFHHICLSVDNIVFLHGGAVRIPNTNRCILFFAPTHGGKTTIVTEAVLNGYEYLSDDILPIQVNSAMVYPFPKAAMIRDIDIFHDVSRLNVMGILKQDNGNIAKIASLFDPRTNVDAPYKIELCVFLHRDTSMLQEASISDIQEGDKFSSILNNIRDPKKMRDNITVCSEIVRTTRFIRLTYSEMTDAIKCLNRWQSIGEA